jgi:hydroxyacylglutathione hydrolase
VEPASVARIEWSDMEGNIRALGAGVWQFQSPLWQTNSLLAAADGTVVLCDPAYTPEEIRLIRAASEEKADKGIHILVTHADFDHVCGIPYFPEAEVVAGEETAGKVRSGAAAEGLAKNGPEWSVEWPTDLRVDRVIGPGEFECGGVRIAAMDASSHGRDGTAFMLLDHGVLVPGDHVSTITYPLLGGPIDLVIEANRALLEALERYALRWVVPGHGPAHTPDEARAIAKADLGYLERLVAAAHAAVEDGAPPGYALLRVFEVEPPRSNTADFEIYSIRAANARLALEQARGG